MNRSKVNPKNKPQLWLPKSTNSSPNYHHTPVGADVSPGGSVSSISDDKSYSTGTTAGHNSGGRIHQTVTPAGRQGRGWSSFGSGNSSREGSGRQSTTSSRGSNASNFSRDEQFGLKSGQSRSGVKNVNKLSVDTVKGSSNGGTDCSAVNLDRMFMESLVHSHDVAQSSGESVPVKSCPEAKMPECSNSLPENENSESQTQKFDLCPPRNSSLVKLKPSTHVKNKAIRKEKERSISGPKGDILRSGMVLLKNYLSISEQACILEICRHHGLGPTSFYQPSFGEGGKMHLKLMCFGAFWNPETNRYGESRPPIPQKFLELVDRAITDSRSLIAEDPRVKDVESVLPSVKPDVCLVNYYAPRTGRLGLHQDKDESRKSLDKGIPIVSFSLGDSAEFLYSDQRDAEKAEKVILESGDVLIFGGKSRHIFHGVPTITPDTAPKLLLDETNFRPGRLNLTFRQRF
ncbi:hypothetical protein vseg_020704 [Gypsophila vaccaria]